MSAPAPDSGAVWTRFESELRAYVAARVPAPDVDDVLQDGFMRIHRGLGRVRDHDRLGAWVSRVMRSAVVDHHRRRRPTDALDEEPAADLPDHDDDSVAREVAGWLPAMIADLPPAMREALTLVELEGVRQAELGPRLGLSPSGARTRVQRARARLGARLKECCAIELDRRGAVIDYTPKRGDCCG